MSYQPKVALAHDDFVQAGGAESLFATIAQLYPNAPIYTSLVNWSKIPPSITNDRIHTSFMQKIPFAMRFFKLLLPLYPLAFESFNFDEFDLVISSSTRFAKSIITKPKTLHIAYVNSIPRFLYDDYALKNYLPNLLKIILNPFLKWLKKWDKASSRRPDFIISNSKNIQGKIKSVYQLNSEVVYPFANTNFYKPSIIHNWQLKNKKYLLIVSRLVKWKNIDLAIKSCSLLKRNLIIVGSGPDAMRLKRLANGSPLISFEGRVNSNKLRELYQNASSLLITQEEDFGIAAVEAQACGIPVVGYKKSGVGEIVSHVKTGVLYEEQTQKSIKDAILTLSKVKWNQRACRKNSLRFSKAAFLNSFKEKIEFYDRSQKRG